MTVQNNNNQGNPYHDEQGKFTTAGGTGSGASQSNSNNQQQQQAKPHASFLRRITPAQSNAGAPQQQVKPTSHSFLTRISNNNDNQNIINPTSDISSDFDKFFEQLGKERKWKNMPLRTPDEVVENIAEYFDDDVIDFMARQNFKTVGNLGAGNTSHAYINETLTNAIAHKTFNTVKIMDDQQFDNILNNLRMNGEDSYDSVPSADYGFLQRGMHSKRTLDIYTGKTKPDCLLPNGCYGSCIYTAYDRGRTARGYAGPSGYVMDILVDNKKAHTITENDYRRLSISLQNRSQEMENKIIQALKARGKDDNTCNEAARIFKNTLANDETFPALLMGYDIVYDNSAYYGLLLNWRNAYVKARTVGK